MESQNSTYEERKDVDSDILLAELLKKTDVTNQLLQDLIEVCSNLLPTHQLNSNFDLNHFVDAEETNLKTVPTPNFEVSSYQSPTQLIQREVNELALQNEATRIKQRIKVNWMQTLNSRKQTYFKQISNANRAEYYEKWVNLENPVIPRKFRIKPIRGEPVEQTNVRIETAKNRVIGEIQLLRMRAENNHKKVMSIDLEMERILKTKANGRILEILQDMWKSECLKEEQISYNRWRYTETWLLDYEKNYGKELTKPKNTRLQQLSNRQVSRKSYASAVRNNSTNNSTETVDLPMENATKAKNTFSGKRKYKRMNQQENSKHMSYSSRSAISQNRPFPKQHRDIQNRDNNGKHKNHRGNGTNKQQPNFYRNEKTTYIGRGVHKYFLGGGKMNQGQRYKNQMPQL